MAGLSRRRRRPLPASPTALPRLGEERPKRNEKRRDVGPGVSQSLDRLPYRLVGLALKAAACSAASDFGLAVGGLAAERRLPPIMPWAAASSSASR